MSATTQLWRLVIDTTFGADNAENAEKVAQAITASLLDHEVVWAASGDFDPEQSTETVDV